MRKRVRWMGMVAATASLLALGGALFSTQVGLAGPNDLLARYFGANLVRAEVVVKARGTVYDYRIDRGHIRNVRESTILLFERDGTLVSVPVDARARIELDGQPSSLSALRRGMIATTVRNGDGPAEAVQVVSRK